MTKKRLAVSTILLVLMLTPMKAQEGQKTLYLAQHGHGLAGDRTLRTEVFVINRSPDSSVDVVIESFDESGSPALLFGSGPDLLDTIERRIYSDAVGTYFSRNGTEQDIGVGWVRVTYPADADIVVQSVFRIETPEALETKAGILGAVPHTSVSFFAEQQAAAAIPAGEVLEGVQSGVALLLPPEAESEAEVTIEAIDEDGESLGAAMVNLQPGQKTAQFLGQLIENLPDFQGVVRVSATQPVVVTPLLQAGFILTSREVFPASGGGPDSN